MTHFCACGLVVAGCCARCRTHVCAEHSWNAPQPPTVVVVPADARGHVQYMPFTPEPWLPHGDWRSDQRSAMLAAAERLASRGELLCKVCVGTELVTLAEATSAPPEAPEDALQRLVFLAEQPRPTSEQRHLETATALEVRDLISADQAFRRTFGVKLARRLSEGGGLLAPCGRGHLHFGSTRLATGADGGKAHAYNSSPKVQLDVPGVDSLHCVDAEGSWWRCMQRAKYGAQKLWSRPRPALLEWTCVPLTLDERLVAAAVEMYADPSGLRASSPAAYYARLQRDPG
jgi:hypothetical protein